MTEEKRDQAPPPARTPQNPLAGEKDGADVAVFPPLLVLGMIVAGVLLDRFLPLLPAPPPPWSTAMIVAGCLLIAAAFGIIGMVIKRFEAAGTAIPPGQPTTVIVTDGLFGRSRNPIYVGFLLTMTGAALISAGLWHVLLLPALFAGLHYGVVLPEERYLRRKFGADYEAYCARVPRWL